MTDYVRRPWRVGRSVGRTIYVKEGVHDTTDILIGMVDTRELAAHIVEIHNWWLGLAEEATRIDGGASDG